jgi:hypothetical protein
MSCLLINKKIMEPKLSIKNIGCLRISDGKESPMAKSRSPFVISWPGVRLSPPAPYKPIYKYAQNYGVSCGVDFWIFINVSNNFNSSSSALINPSFHFNNDLVKKTLCNISLSRTNSIIHSYNIRTLDIFLLPLSFSLYCASESTHPKSLIHRAIRNKTYFF